MTQFFHSLYKLFDPSAQYLQAFVGTRRCGLGRTSVTGRGSFYIFMVTYLFHIEQLLCKNQYNLGHKIKINVPLASGCCCRRKFFKSSGKGLGSPINSTISDFASSEPISKTADRGSFLNDRRVMIGCNTG